VTGCLDTGDRERLHNSSDGNVIAPQHSTFATLTFTGTISGICTRQGSSILTTERYDNQKLEALQAPVEKLEWENV